MIWMLTNRDLNFDNQRIKTIKCSGYSILFESWEESLQGISSFVDGSISFHSNDDHLDANFEFFHGPNSHIDIKNFYSTHHELLSNSFKVYSDRFGIKKFFYWIRGDEFIISNDLKAISKQVGAKPSAENMAVYALTYHFIGGLTAFQDIYYNKPGEVIEFKNGRLHFSQYWNPEELLAEGKTIAIEDIAKALEDAVDSSLKNSSNRISLSLTAGADSKLLFSMLLKKDLSLHAYTYGNLHSIDCRFAAQICKDYNIPHSIYDIHFTCDTFQTAALEVINEGQSLCSLHRAHRLEAIKLEASFAELMFLGTMGGEFIKGANHDDYIISDFVFEFSQKQRMEILKNYLIKKRIRPECVNCEELFEFFRSQNWCRHPELVDFYGLIEIAAALHHAQNHMLYSKHFSQIITPFLNLNYLSLLFQSDYSFLAKKKYTTQFQRRLDNHRFAAELQHLLNPRLAKYPYNSGFVAREYCLNPIYAAVRSRIRKKLWHYPPNFPLGPWMREFVLRELNALVNCDSLINDIFHIDELLTDLKEFYQPITKESQWLKYTTPIQMNFILDIFG